MTASEAARAIIDRRLRLDDDRYRDRATEQGDGSDDE
jgi:hypothetical protein